MCAWTRHEGLSERLQVPQSLHNNYYRHWTGMQSHYSWMPVPEQSTCSDLSLIALCVVYYVHWCDCMLMWGLLGKECSSWKAKLGKGRALTHDDYGSMAWHPFIEYGNCSPRFSWNLSYCGTQRWLANHTLFKFLLVYILMRTVKSDKGILLNRQLVGLDVSSCDPAVPHNWPWVIQYTCMEVKKCML